MPNDFFLSDWLDYVIYGLIFVLVVLLTYAVSSMFAEWSARKKRARLTREPDETDELILGDLTPLLAHRNPVLTEKRKMLVRELREAGYYRPTALMEYTALRSILILMPLGLMLGIAMVSDPEYANTIIMFGIAGAILGYSIPRVVVNYQAKMRSREIERGLPMAIDLLSLGLTGGQNIFSSLKRVYRELRISFPTLAQELQIVHHQAELSSLDLALQHFANRTNIQEVRTLALVLAQSERLGTDITSALQEFSSNFRSTMRQRAESYANQASFWMLFPTVMCLWIPSLIILLGPLLKEVSDKVEVNKKLMQEGNEFFETPEQILKKTQEKAKEKADKLKK